VDKGAKPPAAAPAAVPPVAKGKVDKESLYAAAYELFKEAKYERSREGFENFLQLYPDSEFSDNAQFWVGECYYFEKKYERAIVEYEKVIKNFPEGNKVPFAILKQGFAFQMLGDRESARLLLQQVIKDYPNTNQARIARAKLLEIK
jgi:tol-pal system protein YbgF